MNKKNIKSIATYTVISLVSVLAISGAVIAYNDYQADKVIIVEGDYIEAPAQVQEEVMGGTIAEKWVNQNGLVEYVERGTLIDASTTLVSILNPFGSPTSTDSRYLDDNPKTINSKATTTVDLMALNITTTGTTTFQMTCGASADGFSVPSYALFNLKVPTTTAGLFENDMATTTAGYQIAGGTGDTAKILLTTDYPYFVCHATGTVEHADQWRVNDNDGYSIGIRGSGNTFDGDYTIRFRRPMDY